ncbi:Phytochrome-like protein cph1 [Hartmannibacter diazotrophicus]|uniref:histidine kinase n=1 Tax=Hartmannibacter diazotrophicus TaxID=1482074 RepID=A0A2C9D8D9_9HYPH|nr:PAS domain-containing sensor histidine kinase [Hartmannibacter diazotrophicus]SON56536.1 Phytochrome-like protein cph1 [Hartmannibacter diazotrophicus]
MPTPEKQRHYLEDELYTLMRQDDRIFRFLEISSLDGIWYSDLINEGHEWMSDRYKQLLGYGDEDIEYSSDWWMARIHPDDLILSRENLRRHIEDPNHPYDQVVRYFHKNGSTVWVRCRGIVIRDDAGRPTRLLGAHVDVTDLRRAEELSDVNADLKNKNEALRSFASIVAHDLQTPMRHVGIYAGLLREVLGDGIDDTAKEYVEVIERGAIQMRRMVQSLLDFSRFAYTNVKAGPVELDSIVDEVRDLLRFQIEEAQGEITTDGLPEIYAERALIVRLMQNLLSNALKYRGDKPARVYITSKEVNQQCAIVVSDNGIGIPTDYKEAIFEIFRRLHRDEKTYEGLGVGLAICRQIVESHGGRIWLEDDQPEEGASFAFTLPRNEVEFVRMRQ